jgi:hypothetical protein
MSSVRAHPLSSCVLVLAFSAAFVSAPAPALAAAAAAASRLTAELPTGVLTATQLRCPRPSATFNQSLPWAQSQLGFESITPLSQGAGVRVAIADSGVDGSIPQLRGRVSAGVDLTAKGAADTDCLGRGTALAAIVAARVTPDARFVGLAPKATILPLRVVLDQNEPSSDLIAAAIRAAVDGRAKVVLIGSANWVDTSELNSAVSYAVAHDVVIVAPAPAPVTDPNTDVAPTPLRSSAVLTVAGTSQTGARTASSSVTGSGPAASPDLIAPGDEVTSLAVQGRGSVVGSGDVYAAAFVAGAAALVRAYYPDLSAAGVINRLERTAQHSPPPLPDRTDGWGMVSPYQAVVADLSAAPTAPSGAGPAFTILRAAEDPHPGRFAALLAVLGLLAATIVTGAVAATVRRARGQAGIGASAGQ